MDLIRTVIHEFALIDLLALAWLLLGVLAGMLRGLAPLFGALLWICGSLGLARALSPSLLSALANTEGTDEPGARLLAYGALAGTALLLPALGRLLGKRELEGDEPRPLPRDKSLGVAAGLLCAVLLLVLALPYAGAIERVGATFPRSYAATLADGVAARLGWLFPPSHQSRLDALRRSQSAEG